MKKKSKGGKRGKLTGAAKTAFLAKMAAGRAKAKRRGSKSKPAARSAPRRTSASRPRPASKPRRKGQTPKQRAASMRNLAKARSARRSSQRAGKKHSVGPFSYHRPARNIHVPRHMSFEARHHMHRGYETAYEGRGRKRGQTAKQRAASMRNLRKAQAALGRKSHHPKKKSKGGGQRPHKARENPLSPMGLLGGGASLLLGFLVEDFSDRMLATHSLTDKNQKDSSGNELYADNPPTTGSYANLFNPTAICAPMNLARWAVGALITGVPIGWSGFLADGGSKTFLQTFGFGAGARWLGKGLVDGIAWATKKFAIGQRLYDGEMRAMALNKGDGSEASLPAAGLGNPGCSCANCMAGVGCCSREAAPANNNAAANGGAQPQPGSQAGGGGGGGGGGGNQPAALPPQAQTLTGVPEYRPRSPYRWGEDRHAA